MSEHVGHVIISGYAVTMHFLPAIESLLLLCAAILIGMLAASRLLRSIFPYRRLSTMPSIENLSVKKTIAPARVLVVGGSYGGLAAALNLLDLCAGKAARFSPEGPRSKSVVPIHIKIVDERDGYCKDLPPQSKGKAD